MPTPSRDEYVTLGGVMMGSIAIDCHDWSDLLGSHDKSGDDFDPDQADAIDLQSRFVAGMRAQLLCRINARFDQDNQPVARASWRANLYTLLAVVRPVAKINTTQTITLTRPGGGPHSADCVVTNGFRPTHESPYDVTFRIDVKLAGSLL